MNKLFYTFTKIFICLFISIPLSMDAVKEGYTYTVEPSTNDFVPAQRSYIVPIGFQPEESTESQTIHPPAHRHKDLIPRRTKSESKPTKNQIKKIETEACFLTQQHIKKFLYEGDIAGLKEYEKVLQKRMHNEKVPYQQIITQEIALVQKQLRYKNIDKLESLKRSSSLGESYMLMQDMMNEPLDTDVIEAIQHIWRQKEGYLEYAMTHGEKDPELAAPLITESLAHTAIFPEYDLNHPLNQKYTALLEIIKLEHPETFGEYKSALEPILTTMHSSEIDPHDFASYSQAMTYALHKYFHHLQPTNPLNHPKEFIIDTAKYVGWWVINTASGNILLPIEKAGLILSQIHELTSIDYSKMSPKERIDAIAQQAAEITKMILSEKLVKKMPKTKWYFKKHSDILKTPLLEHSQAVTPDGVILPTQKIGETDLLLQESFNKQKLPKNAPLKDVANNVTKNIEIIEKPLDYGHSVIQYEKLKAALQIEEITSVINVTEHGLQRLIQRGFEAKEIVELITSPDYLKIQNNGAKAFIKQIDKDKYNFMVINEATGKVITALREISLNKIEKLGKNYGWDLK